MCMKPIQSKVGWKIFVFWWTASSKEEKGEVLECKGGLSEVQATGLYWPSVGLYNTMLHHHVYWYIYWAIAHYKINKNLKLAIALLTTWNAQHKILIQRPSYIANVLHPS